MTAPAVPLSVVIPTKNSSATIRACLQSVLDATAGHECEVIVVDNGSTDGTLDLVRESPVRLEIVPPGFVSASRNHGARRARHPLLAFVDSDCVVRSSWFDGLQAAFANPEIAVAGSRHEVGDSPTWVERAWQLAHRRTLTKDMDVSYVPAGNLVVRRSVFLDIEGFDESLETGEDPDLCARIRALGHRVVEAPAIRCVHLGEPKSLRAVFRRERWHGRGARLRYADGRLAPITLSTLAFAGALALAPIGGLVALTTDFRWCASTPLAALLVPVLYAARNTRKPRLAHFAQLLLVYTAYFLGRAVALPVVFRRSLQAVRSRQRG